MTVLGQVHVENMENVVVHDESNVQFFGKNTIKSESGVVEFSENIKSKLTKKEHYNRIQASVLVEHKIDTTISSYSKNKPRSVKIVVAKADKINLPTHQLRIATKHTEKQSNISFQLTDISSSFNFFESKNKYYLSLSKSFFNNSDKKEVEVENEQNQILPIEFIRENKPYLNLHDNSIEKSNLNPFNKNLHDFSALLTVNGKRGPPNFSLN